MKQISIFLILVQLIFFPAFAQKSAVLEMYIQQGLENNLALEQKELNLQKSIFSLRIANGLFFPSVSLNSQYILASGGRTADLPVGDMLNPVYNSLNQLMNQQDAFPLIDNQKIHFLPNNYHDTKIRVILPLVNAEMYYNRKMKNEMISVSRAELNVYKRELVKEIKIAYLRYLQAIKVTEAYYSAAGLVNEALHVNEKLVRNQMAGQDKVLRIKAELNQVQAQITRAENDKKAAAFYFNFLINLPLSSEINIDSSLLNAPSDIYTELLPNYRNKREELDQLKSSERLAGYFADMKKSYWIPGINNVTDLGYQGYKFKFDRNQQYAMNVIELKWNLFEGFQNRNKIKEAKAEMNSLEMRVTETEQQIELQQKLAHDNLTASIVAEQANKSSMISSVEYYKIISRQYSEGQKSLLDLLDAQNQLTSSRINYALSHFETLIKMAELERAFASYELKEGF